MGGIAALAKAAGHAVTGCDANVYPPMSTRLAELGTVHELRSMPGPLPCETIVSEIYELHGQAQRFNGP